MVKVNLARFKSLLVPGKDNEERTRQNQPNHVGSLNLTVSWCLKQETKIIYLLPNILTVD